MYDIRPDRVGWTVYDAGTGRPAVLDDVVLVELEQDTAEHVVVLLNRMVYPQRPKRPSSWPRLHDGIRGDTCLQDELTHS
jgi:hypothetical protein